MTTIYATRITPARTLDTWRRICKRCGIEYESRKGHEKCMDCRGVIGGAK